MKKLAAAIAFSLAAGILPAVAQPLTIIDDSKAVPYLFTLASHSGTFAADTLTLKGIPLVVYFADRPHRVAGHLDLKTFVELWDKGADNFNLNPPNAELSIYQEGGDTHAVLIIETPVVKGEDISFKVNVIDEKIPDAFKHATLFIDALGVIFPSDRN